MNTKENSPKTIYLKEYTPASYHIETVDLRFELAPQQTRVSSRISFKSVEEEVESLFLHGEELELESIRINGDEVAKESYQISAEGLTLFAPPTEFILETIVTINPDGNTALEGLYLSSGNYCTQCEAEGFRRITYYLDRPDVMATFTTTVVADKTFPILLSNGNCIERGEIVERGQHYAVWHDPFPKPSYLFALVAGDLAKVSDHFMTMSGRRVELEIYVEHGNEDRCGHAMESLQAAMSWDERNYGREYDLDIYMIVAVSDFNMGAMENKGLNVFNSRYVLANSKTATDSDYDGVEGVIAHEYFHNWTGNRITCRDWFQLSLKEGLTVFRDQQFSGDMNSNAVKRIEDVRMLRTYQFAEDSGPMAHPVRPASFVEINNFYTLTVYEKGAELIRMLHTLLGEEGFRKGCDLYFERHDGQAVTCDEWVQAHADANAVDLDQFMRWYHQAGTPTLKVARHYDKDQQRLTLSMRQILPKTAEMDAKQPQLLPIKVSLIGADGEMLQLDGIEKESLLMMDEWEKSYTFDGVPEGSVPSLLRGFSSPVNLDIDLNMTELGLMMAHDSDPFNRWDAGQRLAERLILNRYHQREESDVEEAFFQALHKTLDSPNSDPALKTELITLPDILYLLERIDSVDPQRLNVRIAELRESIGLRNLDLLVEGYHSLQTAMTSVSGGELKGLRSLKNRYLSLICASAGNEGFELAYRQFQGAENMTDLVAAFTPLVHRDNRYRAQVIEDFYQQWHHDPLVLDKWFAIQATAPIDSAFAEVVKLREHNDFTLKNPNRVRSLIAAFAMRNPAQFHLPSGGGYQFLADNLLLLDKLNPQISARLATPLTQWRRYEPQRRQLLQQQLERLQQQDLSKDLFEVVNKSLK